MIAQMNASLRKKAATYSPALPYLTVYHQCMDGMVAAIFKTSQNGKRPQRFLSKAFVKKKGGYLLSRIALQYHRR
ncbi:MAG: hypothetical protein ACFNOO_03565, partial [Segatella oulorum]